MDPIAAIKAKKAKLLAEAHRLDAAVAELEQAQAIAAKYGFKLAEIEVEAKVEAKSELVTVGEDNTLMIVDPNGPIYKAAINISENAIKAAGAPLELSELFDACEQQGLHLKGKRPQNTLSAYLSSSASTVRSIRRGVYWLKDREVPLNGSDPGGRRGP